MVYVLLVALATVCAIAWMTSGARYMRESIARVAPKWSGLNLPFALEATFVERIVRARRRLIAGVAIGGLTSIVILIALNLSDDFEQGNVILILTGCTLGAVSAQYATLLIESRRRATAHGDVVREHGTALGATVPLVVTVGAIVIALSSVALAGVGIWLFASDAYEFTEYAGPFSPIAAIVCTALLPICFPAFVVFGAITTRRRQVAINATELALDDAFFSRQLLTAVAIPLYVLPTGALSILTALSLSLRNPEFEQLRRDLLDVGFIVYALAIGYLLVTYLLKPQWHYLRTLWPDVAARGTVERAALRATKREAAARAYRGLPPVSDATSTKEKAPAASL